MMDGLATTRTVWAVVEPDHMDPDALAVFSTEALAQEHLAELDAVASETYRPPRYVASWRVLDEAPRRVWLAVAWVKVNGRDMQDGLDVWSLWSYELSADALSKMGPEWRDVCDVHTADGWHSVRGYGLDREQIISAVAAQIRQLAREATT